MVSLLPPHSNVAYISVSSFVVGRGAAAMYVAEGNFILPFFHQVGGS